MLNDDQARAIIEWQALYLRVCPLCEGTQFLADNLCELPARDEPGNVFAAIPVVCRSCGYAVLVSTNALKLTKSTAERGRVPRAPRRPGD